MGKTDGKGKETRIFQINDHFDFEIEDNMGMTADGARVYPENGKIFIQGGSGTTVLYAINVTLVYALT